jgi:hypothetical protein
MKQLQTLLAMLCLAACGAEIALPPIDCPEGTERTRSGTCIPLDGADALGDDTATGGDTGAGDSGGLADTGASDTGASDTATTDTATGGDTSADTGVPPCSAAGLAINEIYPNPDGTDGDREFIEISGPPNSSALGILLTVFRASDGEQNFVVSLRGLFDANGLMLIGGAGVPGSRVALTEALPNTNGYYLLTACGGAYADSLIYADTIVQGLRTEGSPIAAPGDGEAFSRCAERGDTNDNLADFEAATPTPGLPASRTDFAAGSPCRVGPCDPALFDDVRLSEVLYDPAGTDSDGSGSREFVEIAGPPGASAEFFTVVAYNGSTGLPVLERPLVGTFPANGLFVLGGRSLSPTQDIACTSGCIQNDAEAVQLIGCDGSVVDALAWKELAAPPLGEGTPAPDAADGSSLSRCNLLVESGDNASDFVVTTPTPGMAILPDEALCR